MNPAWVRWAAGVPAAAYATLVVVGAGPDLPLTSLLVAVACFAALGSLITERLGSWWFAPAAIALGGTAFLAAYAGTVSEPPVAPLVLGVLVGSPALGLALVGRGRRSVAWAPLGLVGGLVIDAFVLAVVRALPPGPGDSAREWAGAASSVLTAQGASLRAFATGSPIAAPPLSYAGDPVFDALAIVALAGVVIGWLDPLARSPTPPVDAPGAGAAGSPNMLGPTPGLGRSGTRSLLIAVAAVLAFEVGAALSPSGALLALAVAAPAVVTAIIGLTDRATRTRAVATR